MLCQEFLLTPLQLGIPYSRPRYYAVARRNPGNGSPALPLMAAASGVPIRVPPLYLLAREFQQATPAESRPDEPSASSAKVTLRLPEEALGTGPLQGPCGLSSMPDPRLRQTLPVEAQAGEPPGEEGQREEGVDEVSLCSRLGDCPCCTCSPMAGTTGCLDGGACSHTAGTAGGLHGGCTAQGARVEAGPSLPDQERDARAVLPEALVRKLVERVPGVLGPDAVAPLGDYLVSLPDGKAAVQEGALPIQNDRNGDRGSSVRALEQGGKGDGVPEQGVALPVTRSCTGSGEGGGAEEDPWAEYRLPLAVLQQWGQALDVVSPASRRCNCFTRTYSRYTKVRCSPSCSSSQLPLSGTVNCRYVIKSSQRPAYLLAPSQSALKAAMARTMKPCQCRCW